ncbi:protoporphyrinogen oxidase HemJ [Thiohalorhabdus methylotrophus]|uniref:Protoporphyrinogen IX oxidase n=1 Tax=Thiohalorhabdus methylotrophus TaxID=3242694 RepID=A0ABV4TS86_9GAMM
MLWIKAVHIMAVVAWFAGLFYLPRLYVYHASDPHPETAALFKTMERRLYRGIMTPAMVVTVALGLWLWFSYWWGSGWWLHAKVALVAVLLAYHFYLGHLRKVFAADANTRGDRFYRMLNEFPTLILVAVILLVELKPGG